MHVYFEIKPKEGTNNQSYKAKDVEQFLNGKLGVHLENKPEKQKQWQELAFNPTTGVLVATAGTPSTCEGCNPASHTPVKWQISIVEQEELSVSVSCSLLVALFFWGGGLLVLRLRGCTRGLFQSLRSRGSWWFWDAENS